MEVDVFVTARFVSVVVPSEARMLSAVNDPPVKVKPLDEASPTVLNPPLKVEVAEASTVKAVEMTSAEVEAMEETVKTVAVALVVVRFVMVELPVFARRRPVTTKSVVVA